MRGHMDAEVSFNRRDDLNGEGLLVFLQTLRGDEEVPVNIGIKPRQDMTPIPAKSPRHDRWESRRRSPFSGISSPPLGCEGSDDLSARLVR